MRFLKKAKPVIKHHEGLWVVDLLHRQIPCSTYTEAIQVASIEASKERIKLLNYPEPTPVTPEPEVKDAEPEAENTEPEVEKAEPEADTPPRRPRRRPRKPKRPKPAREVPDYQRVCPYSGCYNDSVPGMVWGHGWCEKHLDEVKRRFHVSGDRFARATQDEVTA